MRKVQVILAALCVAFTMATDSKASKGTSSSGYALNGLMCIHSHEGYWNDPNSSGYGYYGGFQMNYDFMKAYGGAFLRRWGTADHWPIWAQIQAAMNGYQARGWWPWPVSARLCGLL